MAVLDPNLGLKTIPRRFVPVFQDAELLGALSEARNLVRQAPSPWEVVEVPSGGGGFEPMDAPFRSEPVELSREEEDFGRQRIEEAHRGVIAALKHVERHIAALERTPTRILTIVAGAVLILSGVIFLAIGIFRDSHIQLTGKDGAASLVLTSGIALLAGLNAKDRRLRTLPSRIRASLALCRREAEYDDFRRCSEHALEELNNAFARIRNRIASQPDRDKDVDL